MGIVTAIRQDQASAAACGDLEKLLSGLEHPPARAEQLAALVDALRSAGIWDQLGRISWARDAQDGMLLLWEPSTK